MQITVDTLAQKIRLVNGNNQLGAGALAEALMPFLEAALSLPVQPVAWPGGFFKLGGDNRLRECASDGCHQHVSIRVERSGVGSDHCEPCARKIADLLTTPPVPPTKGPEDDLIAAREASAATLTAAGLPEIAEDVLAGKADKLASVQSALLALRSRPASALPVVGEDRRIAGALILLKHLEDEIEMLGAKAEPVAVHNIRYWSSQLRSALIPSVQP